LPKSKASKGPVPLHPLLAEFMLDWSRWPIVASAWAPLPNSGAGVRDLQNAAASIDPARFGVEADYLFGNTEFGNAGVGSDIDLIVVCSGDAQQRRDLHAWLEGWSLCLAEVSFQLYGLPSSGLLDGQFLRTRTSPSPAFGLCCCWQNLTGFVRRGSAQ
jgi:hypothetical protein